MSTATNTQSVVSSASRPLNLRMRSDVTAQRQSYQGRDYWVVKDPISLKYYRFEEEEYAILNLLDGTAQSRANQKTIRLRICSAKNYSSGIVSICWDALSQLFVDFGCGRAEGLN